jgi:hypothetical protein
LKFTWPSDHETTPKPHISHTHASYTFDTYTQNTNKPNAACHATSENHAYQAQPSLSNTSYNSHEHHKNRFSILSYRTFLQFVNTCLAVALRLFQAWFGKRGYSHACFSTVKRVYKKQE